MARYFDVHPDDPQPRSIAQVTALLRDDALIAYPTDSCYALGFQLGNAAGGERIRGIRSLDDKHHFTLVCADFAQLGQLVQLDNAAFRAIKAATPGPYTFTLPATSAVPPRPPRRPAAAAPLPSPGALGGAPPVVAPEEAHRRSPDPRPSRCPGTPSLARRTPGLQHSAAAGRRGPDD